MPRICHPFQAEIVQYVYEHLRGHGSYEQELHMTWATQRDGELHVENWTQLKDNLKYGRRRRRQG